MKCKQCNKKFTENIGSSSDYINDKLVHFCSKKCSCAYNKQEYIPPNKRKDHYFYHVMQYPPFNEFKKAVIIFLQKVSFNDILENSFNFACHTSYSLKYQKIQIKAINKVFDQLYGKNKVRWGYIYECKNKKAEFFWGPYIVIDEETFFYYPKIKTPLDKFIKKRLKNVSNSKTNL